MLRRDLETESTKAKPSKQKLRDLVKRLKVIEALRDSGLGGPQNKCRVDGAELHPGDSARSAAVGAPR